MGRCSAQSGEWFDAPVDMYNEGGVRFSEGDDNNFGESSCSASDDSLLRAVRLPVSEPKDDKRGGMIGSDDLLSSLPP